MTREEYRAHPALNFSLAKHLLKSPAHFKAAKEANEDDEKEETEAMRIGTLAHSLVLEGKDLTSLYAIKPEGMSFVTKEGKAWRDAQTLPIIEEKAVKGIRSISEAIANNSDAAAILKGCTMRERAVIGRMREVECKALIDISGRTPAGRLSAGDFKTALDVSPRKFASIVYDMDYDMQAAWYSDLLSMEEGEEDAPWWFWIATEKKAPFVNAVYLPDDEMMASGRDKVERALTIYKECQESGEWPMPLTGVRTLKLPEWANKKNAA